jgi:hypothetical protein
MQAADAGFPAVLGMNLLYTKAAHKLRTVAYSAVEGYSTWKA